MNKMIKIKTRPPYRIRIAAGLLQQSGELLGALIPAGSRIAVLASETPARHYREILEKSLKNAGFDYFFLCIPPGEENKNLQTVSDLYDALIAAGLDRSDCILALGGGRVGDIAGFVAATLYRGIPFIQIPSTLLAQVDASLGGKTGVNHEKAKNLIGAFYQPKMVLIDPLLLRTLDMRERVSGFAEVLKYGFIADPRLLESCIAQKGAILMMEDMPLLSDIIFRAVRIKARIVEKDERESGLRMILNFGHSIGHAIEQASGYALRHGEALLTGMDAALRLSRRFSGLSAENAERYGAFLRELPRPKLAADISSEKLMDILRYDKKIQNRRTRFVLLRAAGKTQIYHDIPKTALHEILETILNP
ncbi:MAG: 3-dehydroquinate synthase [Candidatus Neomarinimicrobiota bacterium]|jgi:3-dehydroquinate synthase|nr:3-dehydroquinate synthase [Candidatus Neomarinimicrobiota bacterium]MDX9779771.1 3-dehydroquinate synthase [bacterium]